MSNVYTALLTTRGRELIAQALAEGELSYITVTRISYGDGGGSYYLPTVGQTDLVNYIGDSLTIAKEQEGDWVYFKGVVPATETNFTLREVGLFNNADELIAIANTPDLEKPELEDGSIIEIPVALGLASTDATVIIVAAASDDYATKQYITDTIDTIKVIDCGTF